MKLVKVKVVVGGKAKRSQTGLESVEQKEEKGSKSGTKCKVVESSSDDIPSKVKRTSVKNVEMGRSDSGKKKQDKDQINKGEIKKKVESRKERKGKYLDTEIELADEGVRVVSGSKCRKKQTVGGGSRELVEVDVHVSKEEESEEDPNITPPNQGIEDVSCVSPKKQTATKQSHSSTTPMKKRLVFTGDNVTRLKTLKIK